jgi:hypothetical protein
MMTLAGIAYSSDIGGQLKNPNYATQGDWSLVWGPCDDSYGNLAYVALSASTGKYALAIRGSETSFSWDTLYNWFYNLYVTYQSPWPTFPAHPKAMISYGSHVQASQLTFASWNGQTLGDYLTESIPKSAVLAITGHSLGGNLATVVAAWVSSVRGPDDSQKDPNTEVYTFAAPSAGNTEFAHGFNARFPNSYRFWNTLDAVPRAWDNLLDLNSIYNSIGIPTPAQIQDAVIAIWVALLASEWDYGSYYLQTNGNGNPLTSSLLPLTNDYLTEVTYQHGVNVYLGLLNAPPLQSGAILFAANLNAGTYLPRPVPPQRKDVENSTTRPIGGLVNTGGAGLAAARALAADPRAQFRF